MFQIIDHAQYHSKVVNIIRIYCMYVYIGPCKIQVILSSDNFIPLLIVNLFTFTIKYILGYFHKLLVLYKGIVN